MDAIVKFKEAARDLQQDERYLAFIAAREANDNDEEMQAKIGEFNLARLELNNEMGKDSKDEEKVAGLNLKVNSLYNEIMGSETMVAYNAAKEGIEDFIEYVNAVLNTAIDGGDPMAVEPPAKGGCGEGGCSGCSGCG